MNTDASVLGIDGLTLPLAMMMALVVIRDRHRAVGRRRRLNACLHELRRPLQTLALSSRPSPAGGADPIALAVVALGDLDREVNGGRASLDRRVVEARMIAIAAVERWRDRASRSGRAIALRWTCGDVRADVDPVRVAQALDNLIANAIEHGAGPITLEGVVADRRLVLAVRDGPPCAPPPRAVAARMDPRHGHGLAVASALANHNNGKLRLRSDRGQTVASLTLPLADR